MSSPEITQRETLIPKGLTRTRFAPSPTGYMHVGGLRTALYSYLIARRDGGSFILRIEDTDRERYVEGAIQIIYDTLNGAGLRYDEGPDVGGSVGPYIQTERRALYSEYADLLLASGHAYRCFCGKSDHTDTAHGGQPIHGCGGGCDLLSSEESVRRASEPHVVRQKMPREGVAAYDDLVFGRIEVDNAELEDQILLKSDGLPTYNFANVVDDHLMGITHIVRGTEYLSSTPKYNLLYEAFGWDRPVYIHVSPVMRDATHKLSKRHGDPTYDDLLNRGFLPEAVLSYVALLGWSPGGKQEMFTLSELESAFTLEGLSKSPAIFDMEKLTWLNGQFLRALTPEDFHDRALPYIRQAITRADIDTRAVAALLHSRTEVLSDIPPQLDFIETLPDYDLALYTHKKSKTNPENCLSALEAALPVLESLESWTRESLHDALVALAEKSGVKTGQILWPVRVAVSGKASTPGGGTELCVLLGREESLKRLQNGLAKLANR